ncbi:FAD-binding oxidoreductase [Solicola gregarius]|uniref:FAD-binding oxidoreductase n=1 Tax=Solicola gregarius TaxID=2908642 RepID=A0AA46YN50_9ACTN|nr:FAD-binding oxidoreductase [Solicola gregarius]UYM07121.1 FAD-binding oxidoreductase [Solicola gregarius]
MSEQPMAWDAWGDPERATPLPDEVRALIAAAFHLDTAPTPPLDEHDVRLRHGALDPADLDALAEIGGPDSVSVEHASRLRHAGGKSTTDLLRRQGPRQDAPDAVVEPPTPEAVVRVLEYCSQRRIAVVAYGGGTSVVGGVDPVRDGFDAVVSLDLCRLVSLASLDTTSGLATLGAGLTGPQAEALLGEHGLSLGHFPQSFEHASIGGFAATRSSGQASSGYGRFDDMVHAVTVATPRGTIRLGRAPASAAGPDLRQLFLGSEGTLGVITDVTVRVHPVPSHTSYASWTFPDFASGADAVRTLVQAGGRPTVIRLSDEAETATNHLIAGAADAPPGCSAVATFEGESERAEFELAYARRMLEAAGGTWQGADTAQAWERGRFQAPYLRDSLLREGVLVETLETATTWSNLATLRAAVTDALASALGDTAPLVMCHLSHTYATGASLYFTVACARADDPIGQWSTAKHAVGDAIANAGGTITHHHAVGRDHLPWMHDEIGGLGIDVLRAVKSAVDPAGILNPGKLIG